MLWLAHEWPVAFFAALAVTLGVSVVLIVVLFRFLRGLVRRLREHFARPSYEGT
jgi:hypothetical protein